MSKIPFWERPERLISTLRITKNLKIILWELLKGLKAPWYAKFLISFKVEGMFSDQKTTIILNLATIEITKLVISYEDDIDETADTEEQQRRIIDVFRDCKAIQNIS